MSDHILCSQCCKVCPHTNSITKRYFTTTQYDGKLCSIQCCLAWKLKCKEKNIKINNVNMDIEGTFKIVFSRILPTLKI